MRPVSRGQVAGHLIGLRVRTPDCGIRAVATRSFWLLDAMQPSAYGIYLLHFIPLLWLQYLVYDPALSAVAKFAIVFTGTLSISWALTLVLRRTPVVARMV